MQFEFSAGGVVYKKERNEILNQVQDDIEILLCQHSQHHGWVFPKGLINELRIKNPIRPTQGRQESRMETNEEAALREVEEETGIRAKIIQQLEPVTYWYVWEKEKRKKTVYYFVMEFVEDTGKRDTEMEAIEWLPIEDVEQRLTYPSDKKVWEDAQKMIINI